MTSITTILSTDLITNSRSVINTNFANLNADKIETSYLDTDTTLAANSDSKIATQKAVKAYVDSGGNQNASTTQRGIVEEATDAEIIAGTDAGATGARLFATPSKMNTQIAALMSSLAPIPAFQQSIGTSNTSTAPTNNAFMMSGSNQDGSILITLDNTANSLNRYLRDSRTGMYKLTHSINPTFSPAGDAGDTGAVVILGSFIYLFSNDGTNVKSTRFALADLTGETNMTVPTLACTSFVCVWTDGTAVYLNAGGAANTTVNRWTVSGTTFSSSTTGTLADNQIGQYQTSSFYDGTSIYLVQSQNGVATDILVQKFTGDVFGSAYSTTTIKRKNLGSDEGIIAASIDANRMYIGTWVAVYNASAQIQVDMNIIPITKP